MTYYVLPNNDRSLCYDNESLVGFDDKVSLWKLFELLCQRLCKEASSDPKVALHALKDVLETLQLATVDDGRILYSSVRHNCGSNFDLLLAELEKLPNHAQVILELCTVVLSLPELVPHGTLPVLGPDETQVTLSRSLLGCLVGHQVFGTLSRPEWMSWEGPNLANSWFERNERESDIKSAYTRVLLDYLTHKFDESDKGQDVNLMLRYAMPDTDLTEIASSSSSMVKLSIIQLDDADDDAEVCFSDHNEGPYAQLVASNKSIGFGSTATQEERIFAASPMLLPIVLFTPELPENAALVVSGGTAVWAHFTGHLRTAKLSQIYSPEQRQIHRRTRRQFIFADALELDKAPGTDLQLTHLEREVKKLLAGFAALEHGTTVIAPPWGCGAFGGDLRVKLLVLWLASSLSGRVRELRVVLVPYFRDLLGPSFDMTAQKYATMTPAAIWKLLSTCKEPEVIWGM